MPVSRFLPAALPAVAPSFALYGVVPCATASCNRMGVQHRHVHGRPPGVPPLVEEARP